MGPLDSELYRTPVSPPKYRDTQHNGEGGERERERERAGEGERERGAEMKAAGSLCVNKLPGRPRRCQLFGRS